MNSSYFQCKKSFDLKETDEKAIKTSGCFTTAFEASCEKFIKIRKQSFTLSLAQEKFQILNQL